MDLMSIIIRTDGAPNWTQIFMLVMLVWITVFAPRIDYFITQDGIGSLYLCFCPLLMMSIMAYYSFMLCGLSGEIIYFLLVGIGNSLASLAFQYRYVMKKIESHDEELDECFFCDEYYDDER